ncbi:MAG: GHKL domain-containing protein [Clostridia bacterium]|nr:GHKL domain-containing protein [Clostridia bacterium]
MSALADTLQSALPVWSLLSVVDTLLTVAGCAMLTECFFHLPLRKNIPLRAICVLLCLAVGILDPIASRSQSDAAAVLYSAAGLLLPFLAMVLLFCGRGLWKSVLTVAGYSFVEGLSLLILLMFFDFDYTARNDALELLIGIPVDLVFFGIALFLMLRSSRRKSAVLDPTKTGVILYLMIVLTAAVFVATLLVIAPRVSETKHTEFALMLLNVPLISATVAFAAIRFFRMQNESENYKKQLRMQIAQFEKLEKIMEDVRIFRHDFPKKIRPLIASLDADRPEEAKKIAEQFSDFTVRVGDRFHTGNFRLDTVLSFEQQLADRDGITIDVPFDTAFPAEGIDPDDIYTIFPNALDNAIEACRKLPEDRRKISFRARMDVQTVFITIRNPAAGEVKMKDGLPQTSKADKTAHGYGLRSIKRAAAKYGEDNVTFSQQDGTFELRIFLNYTPGSGEVKSEK